MKFEMDVKGLSELVTTAGVAISRNAVAEEYKGMMLEAENGLLTVTAVSPEISVKAWAGCDVTEAGSALMNGKMLQAVASKLPNGTVKVGDSGENMVTLKAGTSRTRMSVLTGKIPTINSDCSGWSNIRVSAKTLRNALSAVRYALGTDETRPTLTGVLFHVSGGKARCVGLDGYRMAIHGVECRPDGDVKLIIPKRAVDVLLTMLHDSTEVTVQTNGRHILLTRGDCIMLVNLLNGSYVDYEQIIPKNRKTEVRVNVREMLNAIGRLELMSGAHGLLRMETWSDKLTLSANCATGSGIEEIQAMTSGDELRIAFNSHYLTDCLKAVKDDTVAIAMTTATSPAVVRGDGDYLHVILPVRVQE